MIVPSQQTHDVDPMLAYCWSNVCDAVPTLIQHWVIIHMSAGICIVWFGVQYVIISRIGSVAREYRLSGHWDVAHITLGYIATLKNPRGAFPANNGC